MQAIVAHNLARRYASGRGVCGLSLGVAAGECYAVLGRNGSGKSTLVRLLLALERPDAGDLEVLGESVARGSRRHLAGCGAALDRPVYWEALTGRQNAAFALAQYGDHTTAPARLAAWLDRAGLAAQADDPVATYSYGMRKKLSLIEALAHEPALAILDEPTAGVDPQFLVELAGEISGRSRGGRTTFIASNDPDWIARVATRVAFVEAGCIVAEGTVEDLLAGVARLQEVQITLETAAPVPSPTDLPGLESCVQDGAALTAMMADDPHLVPRLLERLTAAGAAVRRLEVRRPSLRDAFLLATGKAVDA